MFVTHDLDTRLDCALHSTVAVARVEAGIDRGWLDSASLAGPAVILGQLTVAPVVHGSKQHPADRSGHLLLARGHGAGRVCE